MAKTFRDIEIDEVFLNEDINIPGQARENIRFRLTGRGSAVTGGGKPISPTETIITSKSANAKLSKRDYVATIEEVIDSNRVRVSLSYNDGVNLVKHKGDDQVSNRFKNFRPYVKLGVSSSININKVTSSTGLLPRDFKFSSLNLFYELSVGLDIYLKYFKLSPSIRGLFSIKNEIPNNFSSDLLLDNINKLESRAVFLNFSFY